MQANTALVHVSVDTAPTMVNFVSNLIADDKEAEEFAKVCSELIESAQSTELLNKLLKYVDHVIACENDKDVEGWFQAFVTILFTIESSEENISIVKSLVDIVSKDSENKAKLRLRILVSLFNLLTAFETKFEVLKEIYSYAGKTGQASAISKIQSRIEGWAETWSLSSEQKREIYRLIATILGKESQDKGLPSKFVVKYINSFSGSQLPEDIASIAQASVLTAVKNPVTTFSDRIELYQCLSKHQISQTNKDLSLLLELLRILCSDSIEAYQAFETTHSASLDRLGIPVSELQRAMKLLSLCSLGASDTTLPYHKIAKSLNIPIEEVEGVLVEAISLGLMDATMDQLNSVVTVSRCAHRSFGPAQWQQLQQKLQIWRKQVLLSMETLKRHGVA